MSGSSDVKEVNRRMLKVRLIFIATLLASFLGAAKNTGMCDGW
jgi:hypothetical protein